VAKVNAEGAATHYVAEGAPVPDDVPAGVRLVGPGAPAEAAGPEEVAAAGPFADSTPEPSLPGSSAPGDNDDPAVYFGSLPVSMLRDLCKVHGLQVTGANGYAPKAELVARLVAYDKEHAVAP